MLIFTRLACVCLALLLLVSSVAAQQSSPSAARDPEEERAIAARLAVINSDAVPAFQEATRALDAEDYAAAQAGFARVLQRAPDFPDALRRLSYVEAEQGLTNDAVAHARRALAVQDAPYNHTALSRALLATKQQNVSAEALAEARKAVAGLPQDESTNLVLLLAGVAGNDTSAIRQASTTLVAVAPTFPGGHFFAGLVHAEDSRWEDAEQELLRAQELGMPAEDVQRALDDGIRTQARMMRWGRWSLYTLIAWVAGMGLLFGLGLALSRATLAATRGPGLKEADSQRGARAVRTLYRCVIVITSLAFYASIPMLVLLLLAAGAGVLVLFMALGFLPIKLLLILGLIGFFTLSATLRSLFIRIKDTEPGRPVARAEAPGLWGLAEEVAGRVGTRPVDGIYLTPGVEVAVTERGSALAKLRGRGQRCLILGLGALPGLRCDVFRAILAHEYGHFSNRDTAGGTLAIQVRASMTLMAYGLARAGQNHRLNPAWLFLIGYDHIYQRITLGASRLQEILADRYAAAAYGGQNLIAGLKHMVHQDLAFGLQVRREMELAQELRRGIQNLYALPALETPAQHAQYAEQFEAVMTRPTSPYDSHPAMQERIALLEQQRVDGTGVEDSSLVSSLLPNLGALQAEMTSLMVC